MKLGTFIWVMPQVVIRRISRLERLYQGGGKFPILMQHNS